MKLSWSDLSVEEQQNFGNGCGTVRSFIRPPQLVFKASCRQHDFYYARGGNCIDKLLADIQFTFCMLKNAWGQPGFHHFVFYFVAAIVYGFFVGIFGWRSFSFGPYLSKDEIIENDLRRKSCKE